MISMGVCALINGSVSHGQLTMSWAEKPVPRPAGPSSKGACGCHKSFSQPAILANARQEPTPVQRSDKLQWSAPSSSAILEQGSTDAFSLLHAPQHEQLRAL